MIWSSQLGAEERHVASAAALLPDPRARHYWDGDRVVGGRYADVLGLDEAAWDVWLLFGRDVTWQDAEGVPEPTWWEHQLESLPDSLHLDPDRFARKAEAILRPDGARP